MTTADPEWRRVSPLSVLFHVGRIVRQIARNLVQVAVPAAAALAATGGFSTERLVTLALSVCVMIALVALWAYINFRYRLHDDAVEIRTGILSKKQLTLEFDRIQALNVSKNPVYRIAGLVDVRFDTAGSATSEGHLPAVRPELVEELRRKIREEASPGTRDAGPLVTKDDSETFTLNDSEDGDIVRIGLSSNRALFALAIAAPIVFGIETFTDPDDLAEGGANSTFGKLFVFSPDWTLGSLVIAVIAAALLMGTLSIIGAWIRFHNYRLSDDGERLHAESGLITIRGQTLTGRKVQAVTIWHNWAHRLLARRRIQARQAAGFSRRAEPLFEVPVVRPADITNVVSALVGQPISRAPLDSGDLRFTGIDSRWRRGRWFLVSLLPAVFIAPFFGLQGEWPTGWVVAAAWLVGSAIGVELRYRHWGLAVSDEAIAIRRGLLGTRVDLFLPHKLQTVGLSQTPFQRRLGLTSLHLTLASFSVAVPHLDSDRAKTLADRLIAVVETSRRPWI